MLRRSRLQPQHPHWYEDLPDKHDPVRPDAALFDDLNYMDADRLEISRQSSIMRGIGSFFSIVVCSLLAVMIGKAFGVFLPLDFDALFPFFLSIVLILGTFGGGYYLLKLDTRMPRDRPIRFNRATGKVYVHEFHWNWNPFTPWYSEVKVFDWDNLHAELTRQAGYSGKVYMERYALSLASCKPGTLEVVDRFDLKSGMPTTNELYRAWAYVRRYMEHGVEGLPKYKPRPQGVSFRRSFFEHMPFLDPTQEGREVRDRMSDSDWMFNIPVVLLLFWLFIPWGIFHYIAMRLAPEPVWPPEIDAESRITAEHAG